jgi:hypothetical protein
MVYRHGANGVSRNRCDAIRHSGTVGPAYGAVPVRIGGGQTGDPRSAFARKSLCERSLERADSRRTEDGAAQWFPFALPANAANGEPCPDPWYCHGFREWYLFGSNSRDRIVDRIVELLPQPSITGSIQGTLHMPDGSSVNQAVVWLYDSYGDFLDRFVVGPSGSFFFEGVDPCDCVLYAALGYWSTTHTVHVSAGQTTGVSVTLDHLAIPM